MTETDPLAGRRVPELLRRVAFSRLGSLLAVANAAALLLLLVPEAANLRHGPCTTVLWGDYALVGPFESPLVALLLVVNAPSWVLMYLAEWLAQPWWNGLCVASAAALERAFLVAAGAVQAHAYGALVEEAWRSRRTLVRKSAGEIAPPSTGRMPAPPEPPAPARAFNPKTARKPGTRARRRQRMTAPRIERAITAPVLSAWSVERPSSTLSRGFLGATIVFLLLLVTTAASGSDATVLLWLLGVPLPAVGAAVVLREWLDDNDTSTALLATALSAPPCAALLFTLCFWGGCE